MTTDRTELTLLVDNTSGDDGLAGEHGLACLIRRGNNHLLFDTGQSDLLLRNARHLPKDLSALHSVILSHGHYDHAGGLKSLFQNYSIPKLYVHPNAFAPKYALDKDGKVRFIGMPLTETQVRLACDIVPTARPTEILDGIFVTGPVPRTTTFEDTGGNFFQDESCQSPDLLPDDQSLFWESPSGTVVLLGCAHAGVINLLSYVRRLTENKPIRAVLGGMHLLNASPSRLEKTLAALRDFNVKTVAPVHCSGPAAMTFLQTQLPNQYQTVRTGSTIVLD